MIFVLAGLMLIAVNVFAITRDRKMNDTSRQRSERMHSRLPWLFREPEYYEDVGRFMNILGLAGGVALVLWGIAT